METTFHQYASLTPERQQLPWFQAATLRERLSSRPVKPLARQRGTGQEQTPGQKILTRWKAQRPFVTGTVWEERLALDSIDEEELLALLEEAPEELQHRLSQPTIPGWVKDLTSTLQSGSSTLPLTSEEQETLWKNFPDLEPFAPLLCPSIDNLQAGIGELVNYSQIVPFAAKHVLALLLPHLLRQLGSQVSRTLVLELNIARLRGLLQGETPEQRYHSYLRLLSQAENLQAFLEEYSVLARSILNTAQLWVRFSLTFLQRLCADWQELLRVLKPEVEPGLLTTVAGGAGDTHKGGQTVMILSFSSGWKVVYKPKSLEVDLHFQELLAWLNEQGASPSFRPLKLLSKEGYGWTEFIEAGDCATRDEVQRFYQRQGGYLALLHLLEATDFHHENILAVGEHPFLVDLEALFHPRLLKRAEAVSLGQEVIEHSVLRSTLLPWRVQANEESEGIDISGLSRASEGQLSPFPLPRWEEPGTDHMYLVRKQVEIIRESRNCPRLDGQEVQPLAYVEDLVNGFLALYHVLLANRESLLTIWLPRFAGDEVRFVPRATQNYATYLHESFHPNLLRHALKRERFFDYLWVDAERFPLLKALIAAERRDLLQGDIPFFRTYPESRDLWTSHGECIPAVFEPSSLELVCQSLQHLSEDDLRRQVWLIRASFSNIASACQGLSVVPKESVTPPPLNLLPERAQFLAQAHTIGDLLLASSLQDQTQVDWLGVTQLREQMWGITPAGIDLYDGLPGITLFLAYLGQIGNEDRYTRLAKVAYSSLRELSRRIQTFLEPSEKTQMSIGAFTGLGSYIYLSAHLAFLWNDPLLLQEAEEFLPNLFPLIEKDEQYHLLGGAAGCILSILPFATLTSSDTALQVARRCGEYLLASAQPMQVGVGWKPRQQDVPLTGLSQGAAGISLSLLRLACVTGEERFQVAALSALAYEQSCFSSPEQNWLDLRKRKNTSSLPPRTPGLSWSHGAPGIALGRLLSLPYLEKSVVLRELEIALQVTQEQSFGYEHEQVGPNHSLAAGDSGNLDIVLLAAQKLDQPQLHQCLKQRSAQLLQDLHTNNLRTGIPLNRETPGLMRGLAGMGYQCLRLAEPLRVPSVLALDGPILEVDVETTTNLTEPYSS